MITWRQSSELRKSLNKYQAKCPQELLSVVWPLCSTIPPGWFGRKWGRKGDKKKSNALLCIRCQKMELIGNSLDGIFFFTFYIWIIIWKQILQLILNYCTNSLVKSRAQPKSAWLLAEDSCHNLDPFVLKSFFPPSFVFFFHFTAYTSVQISDDTQCHVSWEENNQPVHFSSFSTTVTRGVWKLLPLIGFWLLTSLIKYGTASLRGFFFLNR